MKKKAFTLVEVLAVLVILAIIMVIAVPTVNRSIESRKKDSFFVSAKSILRDVEYENWSSSTFTYASLASLQISGISSANYDLASSYIYVENGNFKINLVGTGKFAGLYACGISKSSKEVTVGTTACGELAVIYYDSAKEVNKPLLATGMTAVKWNDITSTWDEVENPNTDTSWYDYQNKIWANARTEDGSMWVWIPRFIYGVGYGWHDNETGQVQMLFSIGTDDTIGGMIPISTDPGSNASQTGTNHPAFRFGTTEVTGFWVAKFEATASEGVANGYTADGLCPTSGDNVTTKTVKSIPNAQSWRCIQVGNAFTVSRNMETNSVYGWGTTGSGIDTHLIKNTEWGAIVYLAETAAGKDGEEIWVNPSDNYTTGCAGDSATSSSTTGCLRTYQTSQGVQASTTGNIYGVYDMSGGAGEFVAAYLNNGDSNLDNGSSIVSASNQYKNIYTKADTDAQANNYALTINQKGDALYETSDNIMGAYSWYNDFARMPSTNNPWFLRGSGSGDDAGAFCFWDASGGAYSRLGFRPILMIKPGL